MTKQEHEFLIQLFADTMLQLHVMTQLLRHKGVIGDSAETLLFAVAVQNDEKVIAGIQGDARERYLRLAKAMGLDVTGL